MIFKIWLVVFIGGFVLGLILAGKDIYKKVKEQKQNEEATEEENDIE